MGYANLLFASVVLPLSALALFFDRSAEYKNLILCLTSVLFLLWGKPFAAVLILLSWLVDFFIALGIEKFRQAKHLLLGADAAWNLLLLLVYTKPWVFGSHRLSYAYIIAGMAFYTLKNFSYVYDVYSKKIKAEHNPFCLMTYSIAYPFLMAGPVVRYGDMEPQIRSRTLDSRLMSEGLCSFAAGFAKTVILLPVLEGLSDITIYAKELTRGGAWIGVIAFFVQAYVAFSGMADMGVGIAKINCFDVESNYRPISSERMMGSLVGSCNTSMINFFKDIRGEDKIKGAVLTVLLGGFAGLFYGGGRYMMLIGTIIGIWLAAEFCIGYDKIEKLPRWLRFVLTLAAALLILSALAFKQPEERAAWFNALLGRKNTPHGLGTGVASYIRHNAFVLAAALVYVSPLRTLIGKTAENISKKSTRGYAAVQRTRTVFLALAMIISYLLLAASKL